jgi:predicted TIM-barrel fold metal-dependent hydrolase
LTKGVQVSVVANAESGAIGRDGRNPVVVVSADTHVGPLMPQLREYCPRRWLDEFDAFTGRLPEDRLGGAAGNLGNGSATNRDAVAKYILPDYRWNAQAAGHHDVHARLADMDRDGVACEVLFHGSLNGEPLPLVPNVQTIRGGAAQDPATADREAEGLRIYNRWLADFCSVEPARHVGLCHVPMWDIEASTAEVVWAHEHGLRGVNFPAPTSHLAPYEDPAWEPFFATCAERDMVLNTHIGGGETSLYSAYKGPAWFGAFMLESPWLGRRAMWLMTFTGAFDRHPTLKLVLTELPGAWWDLTVRDMDGAYFNWRGGSLRETLKKKPSEYAASNMFMGASFQSREEAEMAVERGFDDRLMWGSDYPHVEGTWMYTDNPDEPSVTRLSLANTFHDLPDSPVRKMTGENAVRCYGLDVDALGPIAARIGPDLGELQHAPDLAQVPDNYHGSGFRTHGAMG